MFIVVIAPSDNLPLAVAEVENLVSILGKEHRIRLYQHNVSEEKIAFDQNGKVDWVWVCSHSTDRGVLLSNKVLWETGSFARWLLTTGASLCILNSCFSSQIVYEIQRFVDVGVVATIRPEGISDQSATINSVYLAQALLSQNSVEEAVRFATGNGAIQYRYFPTIMPNLQPDQINLHKDISELTRMVQTLNETVKRHDETISALNRIIRGDPDLDVLPIQKQLAAIRETLHRREQKEREQETSNIIISPVQLIISFVGLMVVFGVILYILLRLIQ